MPFERLKTSSTFQADVVWCLQLPKCVCFPCICSAGCARQGSGAWSFLGSWSSSWLLLLNLRWWFCLQYLLQSDNVLRIFVQFLRSCRHVKCGLGLQFACIIRTRMIPNLSVCQGISVDTQRYQEFAKFLLEQG